MADIRVNEALSVYLNGAKTRYVNYPSARSRLAKLYKDWNKPEVAANYLD